jgi:large subunit ribosomal protein L21
VKAGQPTVKGAKVTAEIVRHGRADKIVVFRFKRRKNYRKKTGHRQEYTELQITDVKA